MKRVLKSLFCVLLSALLLLSCVGCKSISTSGKGKFVRCAPCMVSEIAKYNEEYCKVFFAVHKHMALASPKIEVNRKSDLSYLKDELQDGVYVIKFYTEKGTTIRKNQIQDGVMVTKEIPYEKELTLYVWISSKFEDVCDYEYRKANGLWTDPQTLDFYQRLQKEWESA